MDASAAGRPGVSGVLIALVAAPADAHRSGCHRWHSCPSDTRSYVCGDLRYGSQCPDNAVYGGGRPRPVAAAPSPPAYTAVRIPVTVDEVVDGDTVRVRFGEGRAGTVRVIGLDTPETKDPRKPVQCFGREATAKATELLAGRAVTLEADPTQGDRNKYGRLLRYIWLPDGRNFAEVMMADGYGHEYTFRLPLCRAWHNRPSAEAKSAADARARLAPVEG